MERQSAQRHTAQDTPEDGDAKLLVLSHDTAQGARRPCVPSVLLCACQAPRLKWRARIRLPFVPTVVALVHFHPCQFLVYCSCRAVHCAGSLFHSHAWLRSGVYTVAILEKRALGARSRAPPSRTPCWSGPSRPQSHARMLAWWQNSPSLLVCVRGSPWDGGVPPLSFPLRA